MNPTFGVLVGIGIILVLWGVIKVEKRLSYAEMRRLLEDRQQYLPQLRDTTDKMLTRMRELAIEAGRASLEEYYEKYLARNDTYQKEYRSQKGKQKDVAVKRKVAIITSLHKKGFSSKNIYFYELEDKDENGLVVLKKEYNTYYSRNNDKELAKNLDRLFNTARRVFSGHTIAEMAKHNDLPYKDPKYNAKFYDLPKYLDCILKYYHKKVDKRFDELMKGEDL